MHLPNDGGVNPGIVSVSWAEPNLTGSVGRPWAIAMATWRLRLLRWLTSTRATNNAPAQGVGLTAGPWCRPQDGMQRSRAGSFKITDITNYVRGAQPTGAGMRTIAPGVLAVTGAGW